MSPFTLKISSPEGDLFHGEITKLSLRGTEGELAVMAGHIPFVTAIRPGLCRLELEDGSERAGQANGGMLTVGKDMTVLLCGSFTWEE
jgi:F-type H+-transporting ATPase subunit epsilon